MLNLTIDQYAYTTIEPTTDDRVTFCASDTNQVFESDGVEAMEIAEPLALHRATYRRIMRQFNHGEARPCRITTFCDAPPGSGLGTSSTMVVSMVKAYVEWLNLPLGEYEIAHLAFEIERLEVGLQGGRQDQYAATFGGVNFMEFHANDRVVVNPLRIKNWIVSELEMSLVLFNSGQSRSSAAIITEQTDNVRNRRGTTLHALHELKLDAYQMKDCLLRGDFERLAAVMRKTWDDKKQLADSVTNSHINTVMRAAFAAGAQAGKVTGAGGGGYIIFLVAPQRRMDVIHALRQQERGQVMTCHLTRHGSQGWKILPPFTPPQIGSMLALR